MIFRTYLLPNDNRDVRFGIDEDANDLNSCVNLYWDPFRDSFRLYGRRRAARRMGLLETGSAVGEPSPDV